MWNNLVGKKVSIKLGDKELGMHWHKGILNACGDTWVQLETVQHEADFLWQIPISAIALISCGLSPETKARNAAAREVDSQDPRS